MGYIYREYVVYNLSRSVLESSGLPYCLEESNTPGRERGRSRHTAPAHITTVPTVVPHQPHLQPQMLYISCPNLADRLNLREGRKKEKMRREDEPSESTNAAKIYPKMPLQSAICRSLLCIDILGTHASPPHTPPCLPNQGGQKGNRCGSLKNSLVSSIVQQDLKIKYTKINNRNMVHNNTNNENSKKSLIWNPPSCEWINYKLGRKFKDGNHIKWRI